MCSASTNRGHELADTQLYWLCKTCLWVLWTDMKIKVLSKRPLIFCPFTGSRRSFMFVHLSSASAKIISCYICKGWCGTKKTAALCRWLKAKKLKCASHLTERIFISCIDYLPVYLLQDTRWVISFLLFSINETSLPFQWNIRQKNNLSKNTASGPESGRFQSLIAVT